MSVINTNVLSLVTQNNLKTSERSLNSAIQRLSSGMRINSAKDDAAGQAIANRFTANIRGLSQAQRNANDGISLAQTTEGALTEINNNLQRVRELTVQSANGSNSASDLKSIQDEINQRLSEIDRTSAQTDFNGVKVLSSSAKGLSVQVGANDGETINIDLKEISSKTLNLAGFNVDGAGSVANAAASGSDLKLANFTKAGSPTASGAYAWTKTTTTNNVAATASTVLSKLADGATATFAGTNNPYGVAAAANYTYASASNSFTYAANDVTAAKVATVITPAAGAASVTAKITVGGTATDVKITNAGDITTVDDKALFIDGSGNLTATTSGANTTYAKATVANLTQLMDSTDTTTTIKAADGTTDLTVGTDIGAAVESAVIQMADGTTYTGNAGAGGASHIDVTNAKVSASQLLNMEASDAVNDLTFTVSANTAGVAAPTAVTVHTAAGVTTVKSGGNTISMDGSAGHAGELTVDASYSSTTTYYEQTNGNVTDGSGGRIYKDANGAFTLSDTTASQATADPLKALDAALQKVDNLRSSLGAVQNRFDSVISNLGTTITNLTSSRSRIEDADYATEVSNMSRAQILQQAGTSVLAQANQTTQGVLSLLR